MDFLSSFYQEQIRGFRINPYKPLAFNYPEISSKKMNLCQGILTYPGYNDYNFLYIDFFQV